MLGGKSCLICQESLRRIQCEVGMFTKVCAIWATHLVQEEVARARVRCASAKFKESSPILTACGASYIQKRKIYRACVQSVLNYGTETQAMKVESE